MKKKVINKTNIIVVSFVLAAFVFLGIKKGIEFAAEPDQEKDCDYVYPNYSDNTKPTTIALISDEVPFSLERGGDINDASCLNRTPVFGVADITSENDVKNAILFAKENDLKIMSSGQRHSMGGQSFIKNGLMMDMRNFNSMELNTEQRTLHVQSGATWSAVQEYLDKRGFAVQAMQSINIFTIGGTLSVNAHGIAHRPGQVAPTVKSMRVMTPDGNVVVASPTMNQELFRHVLGGYGLFGVILDVDLEVVPNEVYTLSTDLVDYKDFPTFYKEYVEGNENIGLMYARISVSPTSYLDEVLVHTYKKAEWNKPIPSLEPETLNNFSRFVINFSKTGGFGRWFRWMLEKYIEPRLHTCVTRNEAMSPNEVCDVTRNQEMYDSMKYLKNTLSDTDILQEYFIPQNKMVDFVDGMREIVKNNKANLLNVTIRIVHKDTTTALPYAKDDRFAFVLYFNQKFTDQESEVVRKTTIDLIDLAHTLGGTFYLPYQLYYSPEQLQSSYPEINSFFETKRKYDPNELFVNTWYEKYSK